MTEDETHEYTERIAELEEEVNALEHRCFELEDDLEGAIDDGARAKGYIDELHEELQAWEDEAEASKVSESTMWDVEDLVKIALQIQKDLSALV